MKKLEDADREAESFMKSTGLGSHDAIRAKIRELWIDAWDAAITQAAVELKSIEKHDEAAAVLKLK